VITNLNLATRPFNNRVLPWLLTFLVLFVSVIGLFLVVHLTSKANSEATVVQADINNLRQQEQTLMEQAKAVKNTLTPDQQLTLKAAHQLVDRKRFSWSRLFADLEASLPGSVKVSRIAVSDVTPHDDQMVAELDLAVFAKTPTTITEMISSMDRAGVFHAELRSQNLQKGRGESGTEYELYVVYRPRAGFASDSLASVKDPSNSSEEPK
jgi:Tfp pilus assembly protein PilN